MTDGINRRRFLRVLGATGGGAAGAAALSACGIGAEPAEKLIPYLVPPEDQIPGVATYYATACRECDGGCGVHVRVREGRAVKLEGNPDSPINRGRLCARGQAALQGLYNPDRVRTPLLRNAEGRLEPVAWDAALRTLRGRMREAPRGSVAFVTDHDASTLGDLVRRWMQSIGGRHLTYEPFAYEALREGNRRAFGTEAAPVYDFSRSRYVISFGADFLDSWISPVEYQLAFARARDAARGVGAKLVWLAPRMAGTGIAADEWFPIAPGSEGALALAIASVVARGRLARASGDLSAVSALLSRYTPETVAEATGVEAGVIERLAREAAAAEAPLAVAGGMAAQYPNGADIVAAVNVLNYVLGAVGTSLRFGGGPDMGPGTFRDLAALQDDMKAGRVSVLLVRNANPVYSVGGAFAQALTSVPLKVAFATYLDETAAAADLVLPDQHPLESWGDVRPRPGVQVLQQPVVQPVYSETRPAGDVILELSGASGTFKDHLQGRWRDVHRTHGRGKSFDQFWVDMLSRGVLETPLPSPPAGSQVRLAPGVARIDVTPAAAETAARSATLIVFPHAVLHDGRGANKPWLQELPDPVSKIAWHSWVEVHPETAEQWGVARGDFVLLKSAAGAVRAPVWITPTIRRGVVAVPTGQGHTSYGRYAANRSFNAFDLLPATPTSYGGRSFAIAVEVVKTGEHRFLATTENNPRAQGANVVQVLSAQRAAALTPDEHPFRHKEFPDYAESAVEGWAERQHHKAELGDYEGQQSRWAMVIDLARCTGCSACVTACYAENNIATVGEDLLMRGREMSWLRIERYFREDPAGGPVTAVVDPMLCQHCGNAPCEPVCPVYAAYHTPDGLNGQVYNRCVGTRYCANNCPYKVRYFNWYNFAERGGQWEAWPEPLSMLLNPDVTVREKGVMEKCTFCVQRIRGAQNDARLGNRRIRDGEVTPACAQTCPSEAIVFGDLSDPGSRVRALSAQPRGYRILEQLNTESGITYLARVIDREEPAHIGGEHH